MGTDSTADDATPGTQGRAPVATDGEEARGARAPRRRADARGNRSRILEVASDLLARDGAVSMDDIARAAGVVRRTVYAHFPTREALVVELGAGAAAELLEAVTAVRRHADDDPTEALARFASAIWEQGARYRLLLTMARQTFDSPGIQRFLAPVSDEVLAIVDAGQRAGRFTTDLPPTVLVRVLQATTISLLETLGTDGWDGAPQPAAAAVLRAVGLTRDDVADVVGRVLPGAAPAD
jgi:TetR/AcrR family transcriptional regulator, regulator of autoinduction and epiphytic fitness